MFYRQTYEPMLRYADSLDGGVDTGDGGDTSGGDNTTDAVNAGGFSGTVEGTFGGDPNGGGATIDGAPGGTDNNSGNGVDATNNSTSTNAGVSFGSPAVAQAVASNIAMGAAAVAVMSNPITASATFAGAILSLSSAIVTMEREGMNFGGQPVVDASQYSGMVTSTEEIGNTLGIDEARGMNTQPSFVEIVTAMQASPLSQIQDLAPVFMKSYTGAVYDYQQQKAYMDAHTISVDKQLLASAHANGESDLGISILTKIITDQQHILGIR